MVGNMHIFDERPSDWKDLQNKVAYVLSSCGYKTETPKKIQTPRETIEVDVYAENWDMNIVCECKHWESNVPQSVVLSFRTAVNDIGANKGIIIAKNGFQKGSYQSVVNTNIELRSWNAFLLEYTNKYLVVHIKKLNAIKMKLFRVCTDKSEYLKHYSALSAKEKKRADIYKNELLKVVKVLIGLCSVLNQEDEYGITFCTHEVDSWIMVAEDDLKTHFSCYYSFLQYLYDVICNIVPKIEALYDVPILPKSFYYEWNTCQ